MHVLMHQINGLFSLSLACFIICHILCECMFGVSCSIIAFCFACSYGMRYIAKVLKNSLHEKFPDASEDELMKVAALKSIKINCIHFPSQPSICPLVVSMLRWEQFDFTKGFNHAFFFMEDCWKPAVLPLHEPSDRGPRRLRHHRHVGRRAAPP